MLRAALLAVAAAALLAATAAVAGADPRLERERLTRADMSLARRVAVRRGDLPAGWRTLAVPPAKRERVTCPGYDPDYSRLTLTGKSQSAFVHGGGASVASAVEVYRDRAQARAGFALGTRPAVLRCLRTKLERELEQSTGGLADTRVLSARVAAPPRAGEAAALFKVVVRLDAGGTSLTVHFDLLAVHRGRTIASLVLTGIGGPVSGQDRLAQALARRMR